MTGNSIFDCPEQTHTSPTSTSVDREILARLESEGDPARAAGAQRYFMEAVECFGLTAPQMRALAAEFHGRIKDHWTLDNALTLCGILLPRKTFEAKTSAILLLLKFKKEFTPAIVPRKAAPGNFVSGATYFSKLNLTERESKGSPS